jgi:hypothetical protein
MLYCYERLLEHRSYSLLIKAPLHEDMWRWEFLSLAWQPLVGQSLLIIEASQSHSDTPQSAGLLWTSDQPDRLRNTPNWQHSNKTDFHSPIPSRDSNPQYQQSSGRRLAPCTTSSRGSTELKCNSTNFCPWHQMGVVCFTLWPLYPGRRLLIIV